MTRFRRSAYFLGTILSLAPQALSAEPRRLSIDERVAAQKAIERVYWNHRIWPKENPTPKPPLSSVLSDEAIRAKVEDYVKKSNALDTWWRRPITADQLQAELDRMAKNTKDGATLQELFEVLGNDPFVIAETLARPTLVERLIRSWYSGDTRFHGILKAKAEAALAACASVACMKSIGGDYRETTWKLQAGAAESTTDSVPDTVVRLDATSWKDHLTRLAATLHAAADALPMGRVGSLEDTPDSYTITAVLSRSEGELTTASVTWLKTSFDSWWASERGVIEPSALSPPASFKLPSAPLATCTNNTWSRTRLDSLVGRSSHVAVWTGSELIVWGGFQGGFPNEGARYDPATDTWVVVSAGANIPAGKVGEVGIWTGSEMIVWGGTIGSVGQNDGGRYNPSTDTWTALPIGVNTPVGRAFATAVWTGSEMIVWGGRNNTTFLNTGGRYKPGDNTWTATSMGANVPDPRDGHTAVWTGSRMIVWGGQAGPRFNDGGRYDPATDTWSVVAIGAHTPSARLRHTAVWTGVYMIVWGGTTGSPSNEGGRYNPATDTWTSTSTGANVPPGRFSHTAVWTGAVMIVWGGSGNTGELNDGGRYNPSTDTWTATSTGANVPAVRQDHTAVWTGNEMIVWGGVVTSTLNTGGRYSPATDTWVPTNTGTDVPSARESHTAVWTGAEMIVWGGANATALSTGGRYSPSTDSWMNTSIGAGVPTGRFDHTAVWTGTEMVVWGGSADSGGSYVNTGGKYNPTNDSWLATSTGANCPASRASHTAVWTGTQMIVWGGFNGLYLSSGGKYSPSGDSWAPTSTGANVPAVRSRHVSVWTGREMIVWGGSNPTYPIGGGRYTPSTDSWAPTSTGANAPLGAADATAVWTGSQMIVWGGYNGSFLNAGGKYSPSFDSWTPTSTGTNVPEPRRLHAAVWTGAEMIVWGGDDGGGVFTGGRYNPSINTWTPTTTGINCPNGRHLHTGVWTDSELIVWGGNDGATVNSGGRYCGCLTTTDSYRDADGDGYGDAGQTATRCNGLIPPGYVSDGTDCNDGNAQIHPGATEINDGLDNQCPGDPGYGSVDELPGMIGFFSSGDKTALSWPAQSGASAYDVARSPFRDLHAGCQITSPLTPSLSDASVPTAGGAFFYLVRAGAPRLGSWGKRSSGVERSVCTGCSAVADQCDDGNACTSNSCGTGVCVASALSCDDGNPCTDDSCNPVSGCVHVNNTSSCDDGSSCTTGDVCQGGACNGLVPGAANHLVISQIQVAGGVTGDEFIELYNPTVAPISLIGLSLQFKDNQGGVWSAHALGLGASGVTSVPARGWVLVGGSAYDGAVTTDETMSLSLTETRGQVVLASTTDGLSSTCPTATIIDKVGWGTSNCFEGAGPTSAPSANNSALRKPGGACGNGTDTDVNSADFAAQTPSLPRNHLSPHQP